MYQVGDRVVYGIHGVCDITALEEQVSGGKRLAYLVLEPLGQSGARFLVPTHNVSAMAKVQKMLTKEELTALMASDTVRTDCWIREEGQRKQIYRELISSGDREKLMAMVHTLYCHRKGQDAAGKKVHLCDDNFLRDAEKLLISEISVVMDMAPDAAKQYIRKMLQA